MGGFLATHGQTSINLEDQFRGHLQLKSGILKKCKNENCKKRQRVKSPKIKGLKLMSLGYIEK